MKKSLFLLFVFIILTICSCTPRAKKPFVIISKEPTGIHREYFYKDTPAIRYEYEDSLGVIRKFIDKDIYSVGDTIP